MAFRRSRVNSPSHKCDNFCLLTSPENVKWASSAIKICFHKPGSASTIRGLFGALQTTWTSNIVCVNCTLYGSKYKWYFKMRPTDVKTLIAVMKRHFWILATVFSYRLNQFIATFLSLMDCMLTISHYPLSTGNQKMISIVKQCLLATILSTICTLSYHDWTTIFKVNCHYFNALFH